MTVLDIADVKTYLNITASDEEQDDKLTAMIEAAEAAIAERVGPLEPESRTVRITSANQYLFIPSPAVELTSVTDSYGTTTDVAGLHLDKRAGIVTANDGTVFGSRWYDVTYMAGRENCPPDLVLAAMEMVRHLWTTQRGPTRRPGASTSEGTANTIPGAAYLLPFRVSELIAPHRPALVR